MVFRAVVKADHRRDAEGIAHDDGVEDHIDIENHGNGGHAVFAGNAHRLVIIKKGYQGIRKVGNHFRSAVGRAAQQHRQVENRFFEPQQAVVGQKKIEEGDHTADGVSQHRGESRPGDAQFHHGDEDIVENHVGHTCRHGEDQSQCRLFGGDEKDLKSDLKHEEGAAGQHHGAVGRAVIHQLFAGAEEAAEGVNKDQAEGGQGKAQHKNGDDDQRKIAAGLFVFAFAQGLRHLSVAADAQHKAECADDTGGGHDDIHRGQRVAPHEIGNEKSVDDHIKGGKDHHDDGGQCKAKDAGIIEMVG